MGLRKSIKVLLIIKKNFLICIGIFLLIMVLGNLYFKYDDVIFITEVIIITIFSIWPSYKYITVGGISRRNIFLSNLILDVCLCFILYIIQIISCQGSIEYRSIFIFLSLAFITMFMSILFEEQKESTAIVLIINYMIFMLLYFFPVIIFKSSSFMQGIIEAIFFIISWLSLIWGWRVLKNQDLS